MRIWLREWAKEGVQIDREKLQEPKHPRAFLPIRWIVERTFSWLSQNRRMSKDYERLPETSEAFIYVAMSRLMVRLTQAASVVAVLAVDRFWVPKNEGVRK